MSSNCLTPSIETLQILVFLKTVCSCRPPHTWGSSPLTLWTLRVAPPKCCSRSTAAWWVTTATATTHLSNVSSQTPSGVRTPGVSPCARSPHWAASSFVSSGHVGGQRVWPRAVQGALYFPADQRGRTLFLQGRHHQREPAGGGGLVGGLVQRPLRVVPQ